MIYGRNNVKKNKKFRKIIYTPYNAHNDSRDYSR